MFKNYFLKIYFNGQFALSYIGPTFWKKIPDILKYSNNLTIPTSIIK